MQESIIYTLGSVIIVSILSMIGIIVLLFKRKFLDSILLLLVAFSAGALLGGAFLHLIPESTASPIYILAGILIFFILEKVIHWRHCHHTTCDDHPHHLAAMNLVGDAVHNAIDGMVIAGSYMVSIPLGIATTVAVILHEIPQEIGDFGVLLYSGMKPKKAILYNFLSALFAVAGAILALTIGQYVEHFTEVIIPITAGGFIYIATADLIPELHKELKVKKTLTQFLMIIIGVGLMAILAGGHTHTHENYDHNHEEVHDLH